MNVNCTDGPSSLEVLWCLVTPPEPSERFKNYICLCLYSPSRSRLNNKLLEQYNLNWLTAAYPEAGVFIGGDVNNLSIEKLRNCFPDLVNLVTNPTHGNRILDVILSNAHMEYNRATIHPPVQPDVEGTGQPSDHKVAISCPNSDKSRRTGFSRRVTRSRRVVSAPNLLGLAFFFACFDWRAMYSATNVDAKLAILEDVMFPAQDYFCPVEEYEVKLNNKFRVSS